MLDIDGRFARDLDYLSNLNKCMTMLQITYGVKGLAHGLQQHKLETELLIHVPLYRSILVIAE